MSLTLENINLVQQKARQDAQKVPIAEALRALWKHMQYLRNPDLQLVPISGLSAADKVVADVGCKLYFLAVVKPSGSTTDSWVKGSNHATVAAANGDIVVYLEGTAGGGKAHGLTFLEGLPLDTGLTIGAHTTVNGNTKSAAADAATGFAIIGAA